MKELEADAVERNAWRVAQDVVSRINGEPGPTGDCMKAFVTNRKEQQIFFFSIPNIFSNTMLQSRRREK